MAKSVTTGTALAVAVTGLVLLLTGCPTEDSIPPTVSILEPALGDTISGVFVVLARAQDDRGVQRVDLLVDGMPTGSVARESSHVYAIPIDARNFFPGSEHILQCRAQDRSGNTAVSESVPTIVSPWAGTHHSGVVAQDESWHARDNPHFIDADLIISAGLRIEPGVRVFVAAPAAIRVGYRSPGTLMAAGTADSGIFFSSLSSSPAPGDWGGIEFWPRALAESCRLERCVVQHGGRGGSALVSCLGGSPTVVSCSLRCSGGAGAACVVSGFRGFRDNAIERCTGFAVRTSTAQAQSLGTGNTFKGNAGDGFEIPGGQVVGQDTLPNLGVPYFVTGTLTVADTSNPSLLIAAACSLKFADSARLRVGVGLPGAVVADGGAGWIVFTGFTHLPNPTRWGGLEFWEKSDGLRTQLRFCSVERVSGAGAVVCYSAAIGITDCRISDVEGVGVLCSNTGFARFTNNTVTGCTGYPVRMAAPFVGSLGAGNQLTGNAADGIEVTGGEIVQSASWRNQGVPYAVTGTIEIGSNRYPTFAIAGGTELTFSPDAYLSVGRIGYATFSAVGLPDSITLSGQMPVPGSWRGVEFHGRTVNVSRLERCRLLYGGGGGVGILYVDSCAPRITACEIGYSSNWCVYLHESTIHPDSLRLNNWLHDWDSEYDDIRDEGGR